MGRFTRALSLRVDIRVTLDTGDISMSGILDVGFGNNERGLTLFFRFQGLGLLVAFQALPVRGSQHKACPFDFMRVMTVGASGDRSGFFFPELPSNNLGMDLLDPGMTLGARGGDIAG